MAVQFAVLASGSSGNASLVRAGGSGVLLDLGVGPRILAQRLESVGAAWNHVTTALVTHTHGDHVDNNTLHALDRQQATLYCHERHREGLAKHSGFLALEASRLVKHFDDRPFLTPNGIGVEPIELRHDGATFGFRIEAKADRKARSVAIGYMSDTGSWSNGMVERLAGVDLLGVEFNHDVELQKISGRSPYLIARNLGDRGHLSNGQAAELMKAVLERSGHAHARHVVMLHMSDECNSPTLALRSARAALRSVGKRVKLHTALPTPAFPNLWIEPARRRRTAVQHDLPF